MLQMFLLNEVICLLACLFKTLKDDGDEKIQEEKRYKEEVGKEVNQSCTWGAASIGLFSIC